MIRAASLGAAVLVAGLSGPLAAQTQGDPVHLDDIAVSPSHANSLQVPQVTQEQDNVGSEPQPHDRAVTSEQPSEAPSAVVPQLSPRGQAPGQTQLSKAGTPPDASSAAVSTTAQSRPEGVQRLAGTDRCDPQLGRAELARCQHILELRAQEFHAPAPPQLSAEEKLLAEQQANEQQASRSAQTRLRLASREDPDAELESNQELAALYLDKQTPPPAQPSDKQEPQIDPSLAQVLDALQIGTTGTPGQP